MPRSRPGVLRTRRAKPRRSYRGAAPWWGEPLPKPWPTSIERLSSRTVSAIHREECRHRPGGGDLWPGATESALRAYRAFLARPGRHLYLRRSRCPCDGCERQENVASTRDVLEVVLRRLPPCARRDLAALVAKLDEELLRRTLPDPFAHRQPWRGDAWWHRRIYDETSHL
ncbi:hypothetical protein ACFV6E_03965 [Streptomyces sp. NPDC059785]|uniref:hypothetical protein n=1 Tax=unclassified Streptomyces TaxID=2593676 RepID=UPI003657702A